MARPRIVHAEVAADLQGGDQQLVLFCQKRIVGTAEQGIDLPHGDGDPPRAQRLVH
jgi:hypothetical protein